MKFYTRAFDKPRRRFIGWVISMLSFIIGGAFCAAGVAMADAPLRYVHGTAFLTSLILFAANAVIQFPLVFTDRGIGRAFGTASPRFIPLAGALAAVFGALPLAGGSVVLAYRAATVLRTATVPEVIHDHRGMLVTAVLTALLFLVGAAGLLLPVFAPRRYPAAEVILHLPLPLGCAVFALYLYFDKSTPRNATLKLCVSLAFLLLALLLLLRIRMTVDVPRPRLTTWLARAALPYTAGLGLTLACVFLTDKQIFVTPVIPLALLFLSFYLFIAVIRPTVGITETGPITIVVPRGTTGTDSRESTADPSDTVDSRGQDGNGAGEE